MLILILTLAPQREEIFVGDFPRLPNISDNDTTNQILQDLEQTDLGDVDKQFEQIDALINQL